MRSETILGINSSDSPSGSVVNADFDSAFAKQVVEDAHQYLGHPVIIRRKIRPEDGVSRCPLCYDEVLGSTNNPACPRCWGTTFDGGYFAPEFSRAIFVEPKESLEITKTGLIRITTPYATMGGTPRLREGDVIIKVSVSGNQLIPKDRYYVGAVEYREIAPSYELVGQRFPIVRTEWNDPINNLPVTGG